MERGHAVGLRVWYCVGAGNNLVVAKLGLRRLADAGGAWHIHLIRRNLSPVVVNRAAAHILPSHQGTKYRMQPPAMLT